MSFFVNDNRRTTLRENVGSQAESYKRPLNPGSVTASAVRCLSAQLTEWLAAVARVAKSRL